MSSLDDHSHSAAIVTLPNTIPEAMTNSGWWCHLTSTLTPSVAGCRRRMPFFVEPILVLFFFCEFPVDAINQRYTLDWITNNLINNEYANTSTHRRGSHFSEADGSTCSMNSSSSARSLQDRAQTLASWFATFESVAWGIPAVAISVLLASGSDHFGRRFAILPPLIGAVMSGTASFIIVYFEAPIIWFLVRDLLYGCCGSFSTMTAACFGYIIDRTPNERRMLRLTVVQMTMLMAGVVSPIALGLAIKQISYASCLMIVVLLSVFNLIYVLLFMPSDVHKAPVTTSCETKTSDAAPLSQDARKTRSRIEDDDDEMITSQEQPNGAGLREIVFPETDTKHLVRFNSDDRTEDPSLDHVPVYSCCVLLCNGLRRVLALFLVPTTHRWQLCFLLAAFLISNLPTFNFSVQTLFAMNYPLCWTVSQVGFFAGASLGVSTFGGFITAPLMKKCISESLTAVLASLLSVVTCIFKGFVINSPMMYISTCLNMFTVLLIPSIRAMMSSLVKDDEQGAVFGAVASVEVICSVLGIIVFNSIYSNTLHISSGFVFFAMAAFYAAGCGILIVYAVKLFIKSRSTAIKICQTEIDEEHDIVIV